MLLCYRGALSPSGAALRVHSVQLVLYAPDSVFVSHVLSQRLTEGAPYHLHVRSVEVEASKDALRRAHETGLQSKRIYQVELLVHYDATTSLLALLNREVAVCKAEGVVFQSQ